MRRFDCGEVFDRTARGIPGSSGWIEYHWRMRPRVTVKVRRDGDADQAAGQSTPDVFSGAIPLAVAAFLALAVAIFAVARVM